MTFQIHPHGDTEDAWRLRSYEGIFRQVNSALERLDLDLPTDYNQLDELPIVYVVGVPRSGTTLLAQVLCRQMEIGYINNLMARFWRRPSVGICLSKSVEPSTDRREIRFSSTWGTTLGAAGPHEFGHFWTHWFHLDQSESHRLSRQESSRVNWRGLRDTIYSEILGILRTPLLFRNIICGLQAEQLSMIHARSLFVYIDRDPIQTCMSILGSRLSRGGGASGWWSLKPRPLASDMTDPFDQIAWQVTEARRAFNESLNADGVHAIRFTYEQLCTDPLEILRSVQTALSEFFGHTLNMSSSMPPINQSSMHDSNSRVGQEFRRRLALL